ncbi:hypothetical protein CMMCAS06_08045 [Clavibacter michiganensis subsp. michiganensis]|nr:hypothetical protein CMMCAS06_08045 [Clavibacter michiganensis subsp. michiganensis]
MRGAPVLSQAIQWDPIRGTSSPRARKSATSSAVARFRPESTIPSSSSASRAWSPKCSTVCSRPAAAACGCASAYAAHIPAAAARSGGETGAVASGMDPMLPRVRVPARGAPSLIP